MITHRLRLMALASACAGAALAMHPASARADEASCAGLKTSGLFADTTVTSAVMVAADDARKVPAFCEVKGVISPSAGSRIGVVFRLPETWNGRVLGIGGGGWQGNTELRTAQPGLARGYATLQTDAGHEPPAAGGFNAAFDSSWAKDNPEAVTDFAWRAVHLTSVVGKQVANRYYGKPLQLSVFQGCSTGGRMALMEARRFPDDYNDVIAGAPVFNLAVQTAGLVKGRLFTTPQTGLSDGQVKTIAAAVLEACDALDGVKDGVITDPRACRWDPGAIQCRPGQAAFDACLTPEQADALRRAYADVRDTHGKVVAYGLSRGGEPGWGVFVALRPRPDQAARAPGGKPLNAYIYGDASFDEATFDPARDTAKVRSSAFAKDYESDDPDIRPFLAKGGKLILWHGLSDPGPSPYATAAYYEQVRQTAGRDANVRLYLAPGVSHCGGGTGAASFDTLAAMDDWIATSKAPEVIAAANPQKGFTRPLCAYPALPFYREGDPTQASSFACRAAVRVASAP